jgi:hypothetical protein
VGQTPWAHLDIAGTMWSDDARHYVTKGPTGAGVRLLIQFLMDEVVRSGVRVRGRSSARPRTASRRVAARR